MCNLERKPRGSKHPNSRVLGPKIHTLNACWTLKPYYLGTWTLRESLKSIWDPDSEVVQAAILRSLSCKGARLSLAAWMEQLNDERVDSTCSQKAHWQILRLRGTNIGKGFISGC